MGVVGGGVGRFFVCTRETKARWAVEAKTEHRQIRRH